MATQFSEAAIKLTADDSALKGQLAGIEQTIQGAATRMADTVAQRFVGMGAAAAAAVGAFSALKDLIADTTVFAMKVRDLSFLSGGSATAVSALVTGLADLGVESETVETSIAKMSAAIDAGSPALDRLGISVRDNAGQVKTGITLFYETVDALAALRDETERNAIAREIFGRGWIDMIPVLATGSEKIKELGKANAALGVTIDEDGIRSVREYKMAVNELSNAWEGLKLDLGKMALPWITDAFKFRPGQTALAEHIALMGRFANAGPQTTGLDASDQRLAAGSVAMTKRLKDEAGAGRELAFEKERRLKIEKELVSAADALLAEDKQEAKEKARIQAEETSARERAWEAEFQAKKALGQASLADEIAHLVQRAELQWEDRAKRIEDENAAAKAAMDMTDRIFEHERALGMQSLQDEIRFQQGKAAAAVAGSAARMKAEETAYQKEQELRDKSNSAALGLVGQAVERLKASGITRATAGDIKRAIDDVQTDERFAAKGVESWARSGMWSMDLDKIVAGYQATGVLNAARHAGLGSTWDILEQGAMLDRPMTRAFARMGAGGEGAPDLSQGAAGIEAGYVNAMEAAYGAVNTGLGKIESRVNESSSRLGQTISTNIVGVIERVLPRLINDQTIRAYGSSQ